MQQQLHGDPLLHYAWQGNLHAAIEQLELSKQADSDYYRLSTIEGELRQLREIAAAHAKKN